MKTIYRQSILQVRAALSASDITQLSESILKLAHKGLDISTCEALGGYFAANNEVSIEAIIKTRLQKKLTTTFPVISSNQSMAMVNPENLKKLSKNKFNILEPVSGNEVLPMEHDMIIVPTVGVDKNGFRVGYGGGYYDRLLKPILDKKNRPLIIGLVYDFQLIDDLINEEHDIKLDVVVTEKQVINFTEF
ncbi:5-formyltetrahydrofolate cyclo-ligase [Gammaproteobacteria bacterium]|nr:5-formyltetrahydrofolate cyclo-ligase [Gammaproteobacteria bacterium]